MQGWNNPNLVTYPLNRRSFVVVGPISHHNSSRATWCEARESLPS